MEAKEQGHGLKVAFLEHKTTELAKKAGLRRVPELCVSRNERLANVNIFQNRISVGEHFLRLWGEGKFNEEDAEAILAHEFGHLMDFRRSSSSSNFRNLLLESLWIGVGVVPFLVYLLYPSLFWFVCSIVLTSFWAFSIPLIVRRVEVRIELEADRNAASYLVEPQHLANALMKISSFGMPSKNLGFTAKMAFLAGTLTHPSFKDRVRLLQTLNPGLSDQNLFSL